VQNYYRFKFSQFPGDLINFLPGIKHVCERDNVRAIIYLGLNINWQSIGQLTRKSPSTISPEVFESLKPLLLSQPYIAQVLSWEEAFPEDYQKWCEFFKILRSPKEMITWHNENFKQYVDLDKIYLTPTNIPFGNIHRWPWYCYPDMACDLSKPWIEVAPDDFLSEMIVVNRTLRARNESINYRFLNDHKVLFVGHPDEYERFGIENGLTNLVYYQTSPLMLSRRLLCFRWNMDNLVERGKTYLWTFTLPTVRSYVQLRKDWNKCLTYIKRRLGPEFQGIRVYEVHPGKWDVLSHGLHVHMVCNKFHDVNLVRKAATAAGFGRIHVVKRRNTMGYYLAKYLSKPRTEALKGWRLWACIGMKNRLRLADIYIDSLRSNLFRMAHASGAFTGLNWAEKLQVMQKWVWQVAAGQPLYRPWVRGLNASTRQFGGDGPSWSWRKCKFEPVAPDRYVTPILPWGPHPVQPPRPDAPRPSFYSSTGGAEDILIFDLSRNKAFERAQSVHLGQPLPA